nr:MAG: hypothetical protein [uncultured archaeon]
MVNNKLNPKKLKNSDDEYSKMLGVFGWECKLQRNFK